MQYFGELGEEVRVYRNNEITVEQVEDYARRKGWDVQTAEKWLAPNLGYSS